MKSSTIYPNNFQYGSCIKVLTQFILILLCIFSAPLRLMFGLVAVGMDCGHVYLVDMRLDDDVEEFDEWNPSQLEIVDPDDPNLASLRSKARDDGAHIAFELGGLSLL